MKRMNIQEIRRNAMNRYDRDKYENINNFISCLPDAGNKQMEFSKYILKKLNIVDFEAKLYVRGIDVQLIQYLLFCILLEYDGKNEMF
jgi:hypothetical protein